MWEGLHQAHIYMGPGGGMPLPEFALPLMAPGVWLKWLLQPYIALEQLWSLTDPYPEFFVGGINQRTQVRAVVPKVSAVGGGGAGLEVGSIPGAPPASLGPASPATGGLLPPSLHGPAALAHPVRVHSYPLFCAPTWEQVREGWS